MDHDTDLSVTLSRALGLALTSKKLILSLAESCTGGLVSAAITDIAGSSAWFDRGFITYSNASKIALLAVPEKTLANHGAVSEETAQAMALGALNHSNADIAASITGIAGPGGGSAKKPVGTVCFAWKIKNGRSISRIERFDGNRQAVRQQAVMFALEGLISILKD